jgi:hypothetical protein
MVRSRSALLILLLLLAQRTASAQEPAGTSGSRSVVVFSVQGRLPGETSPSSLDVETMRRLAQEPALAQVQLDATGTGIVVIRFVFDGFDPFESWYAAPRTRELLAHLQREIPGAGYRYELARYPQTSLAATASDPAPPR